MDIHIQGVEDFEDMAEDEAAGFFKEVFDCLQGSGSAKLKVSTPLPCASWNLRGGSKELKSATHKNIEYTDERTPTQYRVHCDLPSMSTCLYRCQHQSGDSVVAGECAQLPAEHHQQPGNGQPRHGLPHHRADRGDAARAAAGRLPGPTGHHPGPPRSPLHLHPCRAGRVW